MIKVGTLVRLIMTLTSLFERGAAAADSQFTDCPYCGVVKACQFSWPITALADFSAPAKDSLQVLHLHSSYTLYIMYHHQTLRVLKCMMVVH